MAVDIEAAEGSGMEEVLVAALEEAAAFPGVVAETGVEEEVRVELDEPWDEMEAREVDAHGARGHRERARSGDLRDPDSLKKAMQG